MDSIRVFAPASVANVVCGFDVLGFALEEPGDELILHKKSGRGIELSIEKTNKLPIDPELNTCTFGILRILEQYAPDTGLQVRLIKHLPLGSGMGSSASSAVAGVFAVNALLNLNLSNDELLQYAASSEAMVSGGIHLDNIAPALLGGFVLVQSKDPIDVIQLPSPVPYYSALIHPHVSVNTKDARQLLRGHVPLTKAVNQSGHLGGFVAGLITGNTSLMRRSMVDEIVEPVRAVLVPGFEKAREAALKAGAIGCGLSGSGPSMFVISDEKEVAKKAASAIKKVFNALDIRTDLFLSNVGGAGARILD